MPPEEHDIIKWCSMALREMDRQAENQDRIEKQTREDLNALKEDIKNLTVKQTRDTERIFERLDDIVRRQSDIQSEMTTRLTAVDHNQDLSIKELTIQAQASGKKSGMQAGAGIAAAVATIIVFIAEIISKFR